MINQVKEISLRTATIFALLLIAGAAATYLVGVGWIGYVLTLVAGGLVGSALQSFGPQLVEAIAYDGPIEVTLGTDAAMLSKTWTVFMPEEIPKSIWDLQGVPSLEARAELIAEGAIGTSPSLLNLTVVNRSDATVILRGMSALVESRSPVPDGHFIWSPPAGDSRSIRVHFNLDQPDPHAELEDGRPYFTDNSIILHKNEARVFSISASTQKSVVRWRVALNLVHRGKEQALIVNADEDPQSCSPAPASRPDLTWAWFEQPPRLVKEPDLHPH